MKKLVFFLVWIALTIPVLAQGSGAPSVPPITVQEADGSPRVQMPTKIIFPNGSLSVTGKQVTVTFSGGGGTTINSTNGQLPYRVNSTTFEDSAIASNALNSTYLSVTSGASGAGVTVAVAGGGTNESLVLVPKGTGNVTIGTTANNGQFQVQSTVSGKPAFYIKGYTTDITIKPLFQLYRGDGVLVSEITSGGYAMFGATAFAFTGTDLIGYNAAKIGWTSSGYVSVATNTLDTGFSRLSAGVVRVNNGSTGASQLLIGTSTDTVSAQLDVRSQSTTRPAGRFQAASGTSGTQEMVGIYDGAGGSTFSITAGGATLARGTLDYNNPQYSFVGDTNTGLAWHSADILSLVAGGSETLRITTTTVDSLSSTIGGSNGGKLGLGSGGTFDTFLERDTANTLAQRNGTNGQTFRVYGTYTDASNYERLEIVTRANTTLIQQAQAGTGVARALAFGTTGSTNLILYTGNTDRWVINSSGHFLANVDNTYDIGASGANRPRNYYGAGDVSIGNGANFYWQSRSVISSPADGTIRFTNAATTDFDRLQFGGTSASFPALKRSGTELQVKLADDSAFASIRVDSFQVVNSSNQVKMEANNPSTGYYNTSDISFNWSNSTSSNATPDLSLLRGVSKVLRITDGSTNGGGLASKPDSPTQLTADQNNYTGGTGRSLFYRLSSDASRTITGFNPAGGTNQDGELHYFINVGANNIVLANESASSTAANRFTNVTGADITLAANEMAMLVYDTTSARWRVAKM